MRLEQPTARSVTPTNARPGSTATAVRFTPLAAGTILDRRYRIVEALAAGSMGAVYHAEDLRLGGRPRALKELLQHWGTEAERAEAESWFRREGETLMSLQHPAIPLVHDTFSDGTRHYLVMDLVEGRSLEEVLAQDGKPGLPEAAVLAWADQILDVLSYLHGRADPLIFRDLKPANLMLTPGGQIRLIDFGIARVFTQQGQGTAIGTPGYAPPEQYQGLSEPASDLYALGATMHHLLTGRDPRLNRPFDFPPVRSLAPQVGAVVAAAIDRALALDLRQRYGTAADLRKALHATPSDTMPVLSTSGSLARGRSGPMPVLPSKQPQAPAIPGPAAPSLPAIDRRAVKVRPEMVQIDQAGARTLTRIEKRTVRMRNRSDQDLLLAFKGDQAWLRADPSARLLKPGEKLDVSLGIVGPVQPGTHQARLLIEGGGRTWSTPVRLRMHRADLPALRAVPHSLARLAMLCFGVGAIAMVLNTLGLHVLAGDAAWDLLVAGLVGSVLLGVWRASKGR